MGAGQGLRDHRGSGSAPVGPLAIVLFFVGLLAIILIHEAGHYLVARKLGFKVEEYFVGFGPKLWSFQRGEIEYGVKALPLGGYVKIAGMNPYVAVAPQDLPRAYGSKPRWQRALVILAGPGSHFIVAAVLFAVATFLYGKPDLSGSNTIKVPVVGVVDPTLNGAASPATLAGIKAGDVIVGVGTKQNPNSAELSQATTDWVHQHPGQPLVFTIRRGQLTLTVPIVPVLAKVQGQVRGRIGVELSAPPLDKRGPVGSVVAGVTVVGQAVWSSVVQIGRVFGPQGIGRVFSLLFTNAPRVTSDATSMVGVGQQVGAAGAAGDWYIVLVYIAYVTVFIGLINLVPLPPFDGGHLAVIAIEKLRGKAIDMRKLIPVSAVVMGFFVLFVLATVFLDIVKPLPLSP